MRHPCEPCTCLPAPEEACLPISFSATSQPWQSNGGHTLARSCANEQPMDGFLGLKSLKPTCEPSISPDGPGAWIASQRASLVRIFRQQDQALASMANAVASSEKSSAQLMLFDLPLSGSKTAHGSEQKGATALLPPLWRVDTPGAMESLARLMSAPAINVIDGGASLPTLTVCGNYNRRGSSPTSGDGIATALRKLPTLLASDRPSHSRGMGSVQRGGGQRLPAMIKALPTVCATDWKSPYSAEGYLKQTQQRSKPLRDTQVHTTGHRLTPAFAEWWMGWPLGWTASNAPATAKSRSQRQRRGSRSEGQ